MHIHLPQLGNRPLKVNVVQLRLLHAEEVVRDVVLGVLEEALFTRVFDALPVILRDLQQREDCIHQNLGLLEVPRFVVQEVLVDDILQVLEVGLIMVLNSIGLYELVSLANFLFRSTLLLGLQSEAHLRSVLSEGILLKGRLNLLNLFLLAQITDLLLLLFDECLLLLNFFKKSIYLLLHPELLVQQVRCLDAIFAVWRAYLQLLQHHLCF